MKIQGMSFGDMMIAIMLFTATSIGNSLYTDRKVKPLLEFMLTQDRLVQALKENAAAHTTFYDQEFKLVNRDINFLKWKTMDKTFLNIEPDTMHSLTNAWTGTMNIHGRDYRIVNGVLMEE